MATKLFYLGPCRATLHSQYAARGRIDETAPVISTSSLVIDAPVARVWQAVADIRNWPSWFPGFALRELTEVAPGGSMRWRLHGVPIRSEFGVVDPERELTWSGRMLGYKAIDRHVLEPMPDGRTKVTIAESLAGPLVSLLYGEARLRTGHEAWLTALQIHVEGN